MALVLAIAGCGDGMSGADEAHDCVPYTASSSSDSLADDWSEPNEEDVHPGLLSTPTGDFGGGYFTVDLRTSAPAVPAMFIRASTDESGTITGGSALGTSDEQTRSLAFLAFPGVDYTIRTTPFVEGDLDEYPWDYDIDWTFHGRMDCYEPNDVMGEAAAIPKAEPIEAFAITGYQRNYINNDDNPFDWYRFTTEDTAILRAELVQSPADITLWFRIFDESGNVVTTSDTLESAGERGSPGVLFHSETTGALAPGNYYLQVEFTSSVAVIDDDQPIPDHWDTPYRFVVTSEPM